MYIFYFNFFLRMNFLLMASVRIFVGRISLSRSIFHREICSCGVELLRSSISTRGRSRILRRKLRSLESKSISLQRRSFPYNIALVKQFFPQRLAFFQSFCSSGIVQACWESHGLLNWSAVTDWSTKSVLAPGRINDADSAQKHPLAFQKVTPNLLALQ
jgi:hypothetical protein